MDRIMKYKGYTGTLVIRGKDSRMTGKVMGIRTPLVYEGKDIDEFLENFHAVIDRYLEKCLNDQCEPEIPYQSV